MKDANFYRGKRVFVTGHTGFKGSWLCMVLQSLGAQVTGYALQPPTTPNLYTLSGIGEKIASVEGDIRDLPRLREAFVKAQPEIVIHMAAQPIVREAYKNPVYTYDVNVMGTVNVLECVRETVSVKSFLNVTTDKVYKNREWEWGYRENEELNGFDPYSNSKSCSELVTDSYKNSFFADGRTAISTARAGNVIGGGDFAADRIMPDCLRAVEAGRDIVIRNPHSVRPYQHVLEPVFAYLLIAGAQYEDAACAGNYNIGPDEASCVTTGELVRVFCEKWKGVSGREQGWRTEGDEGPHEANFLKLDCSKMNRAFGWSSRWDYQTAIEKTAEWLKVYLEDGNLPELMSEQIAAYRMEIRTLFKGEIS